MPPISVMLKPSSSFCNLACKYCFYHSVASSRESYSYGYMSEETMRNVVDKTLIYANGHEVYFAFQGGEPLLVGKNFYKQLTSYVNEKNYLNSNIFYGMQTNGTLIDEEWCNIFKENKMLVGLSLDGNKPMNLYRVDKDGKETFDDVYRATQLMANAGVEFNILTVVTKKIAQNITQVYNFFKKCGFKFMQFIPALKPFKCISETPIDKENFENSEKEYSQNMYMSNDNFCDYLVKLFKLYYSDYIAGNYHSIRYFDNLFKLTRGERAELCGINGYCSRQFIVEGNGNVYPCDFFCLDEYNLGNINELDFVEMSLTKISKSFVEESSKVKAKCVECNYYKLCRGGCKRQTMDIDYCEAYKKFFDFALPYMQKM